MCSFWCLPQGSKAQSNITANIVTTDTKYALCTYTVPGTAPSTFSTLSFSPHKNSTKWVRLLPPLYKLGSSGTERVTYPTKIIQLEETSFHVKPPDLLKLATNPNSFKYCSGQRQSICTLNPALGYHFVTSDL